MRFAQHAPHIVRQVVCAVAVSQSEAYSAGRLAVDR